MFPPRVSQSPEKSEGAANAVAAVVAAIKSKVPAIPFKLDLMGEMYLRVATVC